VVIDGNGCSGTEIDASRFRQGGARAHPGGHDHQIDRDGTLTCLDGDDPSMTSRAAL
jgi:hypothetical protein